MLVEGEDRCEEERQRKETRKTAKKIIKVAKKHPTWYTKEDVSYAKLIRKKLKNNECEVSNSDSQSRGDDGVCGESQQPEEPRQPKRGWFAEILYKASTLVGL